MTSLNRNLLAAALCFASVAFGAPTSFSSEGSAVMVGGDKAGAVQKATRMAEVQVVGDALKKLGASADQSEALLAKHRGDILKSTEAEDGNVDGNIVTVRVTASVDQAALAKLAGTTAKGATGAARNSDATGKRIMILATEQIGPKDILAWTDFAFSVGPGSASMSSKTHLMQLVDETGSLEASMSGAFGDSGFDVIDPKVLRGKLARPAVEMVDLTNAQAQQFAQKGDADVVVIVKGKSSLMHHEALAESGMKSGNANVVARAIRVRDGKVLGSTTQQSAKVHLDAETAQLMAMNDAAKLAAAELIRKLNP